MGRRIAIIQGHPDIAPERLCRRLGEAYATGAREAGHVVRVIDVATLDLPLLMTKADFETRSAPEDARVVQETLAWAEHWVVLYPLWLGSMPAVLKGFFEQVCRPGFAFRYRAKGFPEKLMAGRSAHVVVTMGMPGFVYRWFYGAHSLKALKRNILGFIGISPIRDMVVGGVDGLGSEGVAKLETRFRGLGAAAG
jgi:putative NADPH-quinone reductase